MTVFFSETSVEVTDGRIVLETNAVPNILTGIPFKHLCPLIWEMVAKTTEFGQPLQRTTEAGDAAEMIVQTAPVVTKRATVSQCVRFGQPPFYQWINSRNSPAHHLFALHPMGLINCDTNCRNGFRDGF